MNKYTLLQEVTESIGSKNPLQQKLIAKFLSSSSEEFLHEAEGFLNIFTRVLSDKGHSIDYIVDSYLLMVKDMFTEQVNFLRTGKYRYSTFSEVNDNVYFNEEYMLRYMVGLALSQFLWPNHRKVFLFFREHVRASRGWNYLEIGPGHGLFFLEALASGRFGSCEAIDLSRSSLDLTRSLIEFHAGQNKTSEVNLMHGNVSSFKFPCQYDFITLGEVIEHVEAPRELLGVIQRNLSPRGMAYISSCANCPAIDHIYHYRTIDEIRTDVDESGLQVLSEIIISVDDVAEEEWNTKRANLTYACIATKKTEEFS